MTLITVIIIVTGISNMAADLFLSSGRDYSDKNQSILGRAQNTPDRHFFISAVLGLSSLLFWQTPVYFLAKLPGTAGAVAAVSFAMSIGAIAVFHVVCSLAIMFYKHNEDKEKTLKLYISVFSAFCIVFTLLYSIVMIYMGTTGRLTMRWYHYITLPFCSVAIIQFVIGKLLKRVPYLETVSGTLSMVVALLSTLNVLAVNGIG